MSVRLQTLFMLLTTSIGRPSVAFRVHQAWRLLLNGGFLQPVLVNNLMSDRPRVFNGFHHVRRRAQELGRLKRVHKSGYKLKRPNSAEGPDVAFKRAC
jgi:hypothetical protein